jgi:hypothetical protein
MKTDRDWLIELWEMIFVSEDWFVALGSIVLPQKIHSTDQNGKAASTRD